MSEPDKPFDLLEELEKIRNLEIPGVRARFLLACTNGLWKFTYINLDRFPRIEVNADAKSAAVAVIIGAARLADVAAKEKRKKELLAEPLVQEAIRLFEMRSDDDLVVKEFLTTGKAEFQQNPASYECNQ